ncbi:hydrogenase expression/formation protein [Paraburkholderia sp. JPY169]|uniref:Hydrogenase expression/formation protein n=2 Tax=Burkholderiaceae TaxID=119060 RepID=A0A7Y6K996_9BURK|nr:hydrogenase expression/formation protein [Paraburkholderia youngii]
MSMSPFPIPVAPFRPGNQAESDAVLDYLPMPQGMRIYVAPTLPERCDARALDGARGVLRNVLGVLAAYKPGTPSEAIDLTPYDRATLRVLNDVLGEGEVSARVDGAQRSGGLIQETVFAGLWRVVERNGARPVDRLEIGAAPAMLAQPKDPAQPMMPLPDMLPLDVMNAPSILSEVRDSAARWRAGHAPHIVNLTLLPLSPGDQQLIDAVLGEGAVQILSRGYGNCRVGSTAIANCWRVAYFNSQDMLILNTIEITDLPEVVRAAPEDLADSRERLTQLIDWMGEA